MELNIAENRNHLNYSKWGLCKTYTVDIRKILFP